MAAGCGDIPTAPTDTMTATAPTSTTYASTLDVQGVRFYSFTVFAEGAVTVMLASVTSTTNGVPADVPLHVSIGVPAGTNCSPMQSAVLSSALLTQLTQTVAPGIYCIRLADAGQLTAPVRFAVRFTHT